jgi:hypothetical protein
VAIFNRASEGEGNLFWQGFDDMAAVADEMLATDDALAYFGDSLDSDQAFIEHIYLNTLNKTVEDDEEGIAFWVGQLEDGATRGEVVAALVEVIDSYGPDGENYDPEDEATIASYNQFMNRVEVSNYMADTVEETPEDYAVVTSFGPDGLNVTDDDASVLAAKQAVDALVVTPVVPGELFMLTANQDWGADYEGGDGDDTYMAPVVQEGGLQVNSLGTGDWLDGGEGYDTLEAGVTRGATFGLSNMPIGPITENIENIEIKAINADIGVNDYQVVLSNAGIGGINGIIDSIRIGDDDQFELPSTDEMLDFFGSLSLSFDVSTKKANTDVFVDAADMTGVDVIGSNYSGADLTIMNLTTKATQDYDSARSLDEMTVRMAYTSSSDSHWDASDLNVYFDPDFLKPVTKYSDPTIDILVMNEDAYDETDGELPLAGVFLRELAITINGERFDLTQYIDEDEAGDGEEITTYPELLAAIQDAIVELKADNLDNEALQTLEAELGIPFLTDVDPATLIRREGTTIRLTIDGATDGEENTLLVESTDLEVARAAEANYENNNRYERADNDPAIPEDVLAVNVALEKVGLAGDGGDLVIGSMFKDGQNVWSDKYAGQGIDQFNVTVYGDDDKPSSLASLSSTGNNLRVVNVVSDPDQADSFADLTIGNSNTQGIAGLKDVQVFDASLFKGDLILHAALTDEVTAKYLDLQDQAPDAPAADNVYFDYDGGIGNDFFNITLAASNMAAAGTVTREDFAMNVDGGDGDDIINLAIVDDNGLATDFAIGDSGETGLANWYDNQKLNANITVRGGAGNDIIMTPGTGDMEILGGSGNDAIYADNAGDKAVWVYNTLSPAMVHTHLFSGDEGVFGLQSDANNSYTLYKSNVVVNFKGFEVAVELAHSNGMVTDLQINQAIKAAINGDETLNKLLTAYDGPGNTLVVESKIDGRMNVGDDLTVSIEAPDTLTAGEVQQLSNWLGLAGQTEATLLALIENQIDLFDGKGDYTGFIAYGGTMDGLFSFHTSDNIITPGLGDDVVVLGTGIMSNDTIVYEGFGNGVDTIVNFVTYTFATELVNEATVTINTQGTDATDVVPAVAEVFTLTLTGTVADPTPGEITFDDAYFGGAADTVVTPAFGDTAADVADAIVTAVNDIAGGTFTAALGSDPGTVVFTQVTPGVIADVSISNASGTPILYDGAGVGMTVEVDTDGADEIPAAAATSEVFTVTFGDAEVAATYSFDGVEVQILEGETGENIAAAFASAAFDNWDVTTHVADTTTVTFTAKTAGAVEDVTDDSFVGANIIIQDVTTISYAPSDMLDFSDYGADAVYVDGALVAGIAPADEGDLFITMTQDVDNAGEYTMELVDAGADGVVGGGDDAVVGLIGVADFGETMDFIEDNFIL